MPSFLLSCHCWKQRTSTQLHFRRSSTSLLRLRYRYTSLLCIGLCSALLLHLQSHSVSLILRGGYSPLALLRFYRFSPFLLGQRHSSFVLRGELHFSLWPHGRHSRSAWGNLSCQLQINRFLDQQWKLQSTDYTTHHPLHPVTCPWSRTPTPCFALLVMLFKFPCYTTLCQVLAYVYASCFSVDLNFSFFL